MPIGDKIFEYKRTSIESKVDEFIRVRPFIGPSPPVDIELVFDRTTIIKNMEVAPLLLDLCKTEGIIFAPRFMHRELTVVFDEGIVIARDDGPYRMAVAEEIGHTELHLSAILEVHDRHDFRELQQCPQWAMGESDAKYFGRAILMPRQMLEEASARVFCHVVNEIGFEDIVQFQKLFVTHIAAIFGVPWREADKRIRQYVGGLQDRIDRSFASRSLNLLALSDELVVRPPHFSRRALRGHTDRD